MYTFGLIRVLIHGVMEWSRLIFQCGNPVVPELSAQPYVVPTELAQHSSADHRHGALFPDSHSLPLSRALWFHEHMVWMLLLVVSLGAGTCAPVCFHLEIIRLSGAF